jgi:hypothetical protein
MKHYNKRQKKRTIVMRIQWDEDVMTWYWTTQTTYLVFPSLEKRVDVEFSWVVLDLWVNQWLWYPRIITTWYEATSISDCWWALGLWVLLWTVTIRDSPSCPVTMCYTEPLLQTLNWAATESNSINVMDQSFRGGGCTPTAPPCI